MRKTVTTSMFYFVALLVLAFMVGNALPSFSSVFLRLLWHGTHHHTSNVELEDDKDDAKAEAWFKRVAQLFLTKMGNPTAVVEQSFCGRIKRCNSEACKANLEKLQASEQTDSDAIYYNFFLSSIFGKSDNAVSKLATDGSEGIKSYVLSSFGPCSADCKACGKAGQNPCPLSCAICKDNEGEMGLSKSFVLGRRKFVCPAPCEYCGGGEDKPACPLYCLPCSTLLAELNKS